MMNSMVPGHAPETPEYELPTEYIGNPIESNFFCRAWNPRRNKYCRARAGQGTDHVGNGRCRVHSGSMPITHGRYSNYVTSELQDIVDQLESEDDDEKLDVTSDGVLARAIAVRFVKRYDDILSAMIAWNSKEYADASAEKRKPYPQRLPELHDVVSVLEKAAKIVDLTNKQRQAKSVPHREFLRVMRQMALSVESRISEFEEDHKLSPADANTLKEGIREDWKTLRIRK